MTRYPLHLYGGLKPFTPPPWIPINDTVRGGSSTSALEPLPHNAALFSGHLDTTTLGGAGFAAQFSPLGSAVLKISCNETEKVKDPPWDLTPYAGLSISLGPARTQFDVGGVKKKFTLILKDDSTSSPLNGSESTKQEASISWEAQFEVPAGDDGKGGEVWLPWGVFDLTYRGRPVKDDGRKLEREKVRQIGIMMRRTTINMLRIYICPHSDSSGVPSYFDTQQGDFELELRSISAKPKNN